MDPILEIVELLQQKKPNAAYRKFKGLGLHDRLAVVNDGIINNKYSLTANSRIHMAGELLGVALHEIE